VCQGKRVNEECNMNPSKFVKFESRDDVIRLSDKFYLIQGPNQSCFPFCNGFLLTGQNTALIDAGLGEAKINEIDKLMRIDILIISHSHPDHILAWHVLKDRHILLPRETPEAVKDLKLLGRRFTSTAERAEHWVRRIGDDLGIQPLQDPDGRFCDGELLEVGDAKLEAVHAPGHLNDHYCFIEQRSGILLTTDIDFGSFGPWYGNPECDIELFEQSVKKVMKIPHRQACSSHSLPIKENTTEKFESWLAVFRLHRKKILELCEFPRTIEQIVAESPFFRDRFLDKVTQNMFEEQMVQKNLAMLVRDGLLEVSHGKYQSNIRATS